MTAARRLTPRPPFPPAARRVGPPRWGAAPRPWAGRLPGPEPALELWARKRRPGVLGFFGGTARGSIGFLAGPRAGRELREAVALARALRCGGRLLLMSSPGRGRKPAPLGAGRPGDRGYSCDSWDSAALVHQISPPKGRRHAVNTVSPGFGGIRAESGRFRGKRSESPGIRGKRMGG